MEAWRLGVSWRRAFSCQEPPGDGFGGLDAEVAEFFELVAFQAEARGHDGDGGDGVTVFIEHGGGGAVDAFEAFGEVGGVAAFAGFGEDSLDDVR